MQSQLATSLTQRQQGEQFRVIDPPSFSSKPSAPNHLLVSLGGLAAGFAIGLGLTIVLELSDVRVRHEKDLEGLVPARVLVGIPHLRTSGEERRRAKFRFLQIGAAAAMVMLMVAGNLYAFLKG
jgi:capsular polysaccharide biosynthesis protein